MTTTPYNPQTPLVSTNVPTAQDQFLNNFGKLFDAFSVNHVALNDSTNPGNHNVVELVQQQNSKTTQSQEISIYSKKVDGQTEQLFMRYRSNGKEFQITEYQIYEIEPTINQTSYITFLPGGLVVQFGKVFSTGTNFLINIIPPIATNITGVSLGGVETTGVLPQPQPNVYLTAKDGIFKSIGLQSSASMVNQFYLFFGNL